MSACTHCGQDHEATGSVCRGRPVQPPAPLPGAQKTLFGMPTMPAPTAPKTPVARTTGYAAVARVPVAKLPVPSKPPLPRLPTAEEARENPNLVISLEVTPPPRQPTGGVASNRPPSAGPARPASAGPARPASAGPARPISPAPVRPLSAPPSKALPSPSSLAETPRVVAKDTPAVTAPDFGATVDLPDVAESGLELAGGDSGPTDLPPAGSGPRFDLPGPPAIEDAEAPAGNARRAKGDVGHRLVTDIKSVIELLGWSATTYFRRPAAFLLLAAMLVLPASFLQSCLATALVPTPPSNVLAQGATTPHFEQRKADLAKRIQDAQARGEMDAEAAVALAALTAAGNAAVAAPKVEASETANWFRLHGIMLLQGLLVLGLAFPLACALLALAFVDRESGAAMPGLADVWPILVARGELFLLALLPAALLVALGNALYVVPGLAASVLFVFLPHVVLFEKRGGRAALSRSIELCKADAVRGALTLLSFALAVAVVALVAEAVLPISASRAVAFVHFIVRDVLVIAILPIPALVLARLYLEQRGPKANAEALSLAARS